MRNQILVGFVFLTVACSSQKNELTPGQWEVTSDHFSLTTGTPRRVGSFLAKHCLDKANRPDASFLTGTRFTAGCPHQELTLDNGRIRGSARCSKTNMTVQETIEGRYDATSFEATRRSEFTKGKESLAIEIRSRGRRTGDCPTEAGSAQSNTILKPGKWKLTATIGKTELPDAPPEFADLGDTPTEPTSFDFCMSRAMAADPRGDLFAGIKGGNCSYERFRMGDGKIDAKAVCKPGEAGQAILMTGEYSAQRYILRQTVETDGGAYVGKMLTHITIDARRIGDC